MREQGLNWKQRRGEHGQTILLVVVSLVSLLGMAALAIDVVTLFVAHTEIQRAADAAALAGAKAIADSGATTDPTYITLAQTMATQVISGGGTNGILQQNLVGGRPPQLVSAVTDFLTHGNSDPSITVTLQQINLPTFFARVWGRRLATVSATATAEAYNPSGSQTLLGETVPIAPKCVKPWLLANKDPNSANNLIDPDTGAVSAPTVVGAMPFKMIPVCPLGGVCLPIPPITAGGQYLPALVVPGNAQAVPACGAGGSDYEQSIAGCDSTPYACGGPNSNANIDTLHVGLDQVQNSVRCLTTRIGVGSGPLAGQDVINTGPLPTNPAQISAGSANPLIGAGSPIVSGSPITTSSSIITLPIIDTSGTVILGPVRVIGFMQAFVTDLLPDVGLGIQIVQVQPLNISGCGKNVTGPPPGPISAGGVSPIPVRLIHQ